VQKNLFYQMYDNVDIQSESQSRAGRQEYAKQASIIVLLKGEYDGDIIVQIRTIKLSREGRVWQVNAVEVSSF
jgi:NAD(P)H-hydrate repair Nnr-like enzyme with NAD(P)H-hydrate dehydratase domain